MNQHIQNVESINITYSLYVVVNIILCKHPYYRSYLDSVSLSNKKLALIGAAR